MTIHNIQKQKYDAFAAKWLNDRLKSLLDKKDKICIGLSGGSTPLPILEKLRECDLNWENIVFFMVDERIVDLDDVESNYGNINKVFFEHIPSRAYTMIESKDLINESIQHYKENLSQEVKRINEIPAFDLILLGMGDDGHIASLFPGTEALNETTEFIVKNHVPQLKKDRLTLTYPVLLNASEVAILIKGDDKKCIFDELYSSKKTTYPISKISQSNIQLTWLIGA